MVRPSLVTAEKKRSPADEAILIVDKIGIIGKELANKLSAELLVVYVSKRLNNLADSSENIIQISYTHKFPSIPEHRYSSIFVVDDESRITRGLLPKFIEKAQKDNSQLIFLTHIKNLNQKQISNFINNPKGFKILIYGDIFGGESLHSYIDHAQRYGAIEIEGNGLEKTYPVFLDDAIDGILEIIFGSSASDSVYYLFPKHPPTEISLAHMIQKADPNIKIDFVKKKNKSSTESVLDKTHETINLPSKGKYLLNDSYDLAKRMREMFIVKNERYLTDNRFHKKENNFTKWPLITFLYLILILLLPLIATLFFSFLGFKTLIAAKNEVNRGELMTAQRLVNVSKTYFNIARKTSTSLLMEAKIIGFENKLEKVNKNILLGEDMSYASQLFIGSLNKFSDVFLKKSKDPKNDFLEGVSMLRGSEIKLQKIQAEGNTSSFTKTIDDFNVLIKLASGSLDILPTIFGFNKPMNYLILFQNSRQLRSSGGLIESYGLMTLKNGTIQDFSIHDVEDADNKLIGHIEPPAALKKYLPTNHWYFRDSNFNIDFRNSASKSAYFLDVETGKKVDGVIGLDTSFAKNLLRVLGNNKDNFLKDKNLYSAIFSNISSRKNLPALPTGQAGGRQGLPYLSLAQVVSEGILQKHVLFAFSDPNLQDFFTLNNWSSSLWDKRMEGQNIINDFVGINEANLGGNYANPFIKRKVSQNVNIDNDGKVTGEISIAYDNTARAKQAGNYKNYLRLILEPNAELNSINIDGLDEKIAKFEVDKTEEDGKAIYGFLVNIPSGKFKTISIKYSLPQLVSLKDSSFSYDLYYFKQPGTDEYPFNFVLSYPANYHVFNSPKELMGKKDLTAGNLPDGSQGQGKVFASKTLKTDEEIKINLAKE